jgi:hypothetical protein
MVLREAVASLRQGHTHLRRRYPRLYATIHAVLILYFTLALLFAAISSAAYIDFPCNPPKEERIAAFDERAESEGDTHVIVSIYPPRAHGGECHRSVINGSGEASVEEYTVSVSDGRATVRPGGKTFTLTSEYMLNGTADSEARATAQSMAFGYPLFYQNSTLTVQEAGQMQVNNETKEVIYGEYSATPHVSLPFALLYVLLVVNVGYRVTGLIWRRLGGG